MTNASRQPCLAAQQRASSGAQNAKRFIRRSIPARRDYSDECHGQRFRASLPRRDGLYRPQGFTRFTVRTPGDDDAADNKALLRPPTCHDTPRY